MSPAAPAAASLPSDEAWLAALFGPGVRTGLLPLAAADPRALRPEEAAAAARFAPGRRLAFAAGRQCARGVLAALGAGTPALPIGPQRAPVWPAGVVGSISHGAGWCVAVAAWRADAAGLGVDVEAATPLREALWRRVCTPAERGLLAGQAADRAGRLAKLMFGAKEAIYKAVHPLLRQPLGFHDVELALEPDLPRFRVRARDEAPAGAAPLLARVRGAWAEREGRLLAGATLVRGDGPADGPP